jgi:hypothetical protein
VAVNAAGGAAQAAEFLPAQPNSAFPGHPAPVEVVV